MSSPSTQDPAQTEQNKRQKVSDDGGDEDGGWQKVERRKSKKQKKQESKHEVRPTNPARYVLLTRVMSSTSQASPPKFMYAKGEILKRREAVGINVSHRSSPPGSYMLSMVPICYSRCPPCVLGQAHAVLRPKRRRYAFTSLAGALSFR